MTGITPRYLTDLYIYFPSSSIGAVLSMHLAVEGVPGLFQPPSSATCNVTSSRAPDVIVTIVYICTLGDDGLLVCPILSYTCSVSYTALYMWCVLYCPIHVVCPILSYTCSVSYTALYMSLRQPLKCLRALFTCTYTRAHYYSSNK